MVLPFFFIFFSNKCGIPHNSYLRISESVIILP